MSIKLVGDQMKNVNNLAGALGLAIALVAGSGSAATAAGPGSGTPAGDSPAGGSVISLTPGSANEPTGEFLSSSAWVGIRPGCYGQTDTPHYAYSEPGLASAKGRTVCPGSTRTSINLSVGYIGWFGERYRTVSKFSQNTLQSVNSQVKSDCRGTGTQTWRAISNHSALVGGQTNFGRTSSDGRFSC